MVRNAAHIQMEEDAALAEAHESGGGCGVIIRAGETTRLEGPTDAAVAAIF